jgi:hypothetical protein
MGFSTLFYMHFKQEIELCNIVIEIFLQRNVHAMSSAYKRPCNAPERDGRYV